MKKGYWVLALGIVVLGWYLFIRTYEFEVNFIAQTVPGDVIETIRLWDRSLGNTEITAVDSTNSLRQRINWKNRKYVYDWVFKALNDSTTKVSIQITEPSNALMNKLLVPFSHQPIEIDAEEISKTFYGILKSHLEITQVRLDGEAELRAVFCACTALETSQMGKANGMMRDFGLLTSFIDQFKLKEDGPPFVRINQWSHNTGKLAFDFCFPIVKTDSLPQVSEITYKYFDKAKALKATYHGNYITSDRAWYYLINAANNNGYRIVGLPVEYFYNNPNLGINEKEWKAEIFLPVDGKVQ